MELGQNFWINTSLTLGILIGVLAFFLKRFVAAVDRLEQTVGGFSQSLESLKGENKRLYDAQRTAFREHDRRIKLLEDKFTGYDQNQMEFHKTFHDQVREIAFRVIKEAKNIE